MTIVTIRTIRTIDNKDNKNYYYEIDVDLGGGMCGMLLYDANIGKPDFNVGEHKSFVCYENFIVKVEE